jgi:diguanylate cyclase (GGDEF)-like protein
MKILVIEDDELIAHTLVTILAHENYAVEVATNGQAGWDLVEAFDYDLVLLDVMLPKLDGISLCRQMRAKGLQMPILLLTGRDSGHDKAIGLDAGADDYVVKPFDQEELVARVRALLRRAGAIAQPVLTWGELRLDPSSCDVTYSAQPISLTPKEYALLELFLRNRQRVFSCGMILEHLWSYEEMPGEEAVRTHIKGLRQKLKAVGLPHDVVETVYGIGYRLKSQDFEKQAKPVTQDTKLAQAPSPTLSQPDLLSAIREPSSAQTLASVNQIWHRLKERVSEQVAVLEQAITRLEQQTLEPDLRRQAHQEAHTLAGSLGTFGLPKGTELARQIEQLLQAEQPLNQADAKHLRESVVALRQEIEQSYHNPPKPSHSANLAEAHRPLLLIVDRDRSLANQLIAEASTWGFQAEVAASLPRARDKIFLKSPDVVLLDPATSPTAAESLSLLNELSKQVPPVPVVILTEHYDLAERLEVARLGGRTLLQKSAPLAEVLGIVQQVLHQADRTKAQVMVVDDDPALLAVVRSLLEPWGLKVTTLADPQQFWQVLEATSPDLLILDIEMPQISGIELCQIVRNDASWGRLPILFLTAHTDHATVNQVFSAGADDFVSKPIAGPELVTRIINRLERIRFSQNWVETDPLTQVATRRRATPDLERLLRLAKRQQQPFCLTILKVDWSRSMGDRHSLSLDDKVLHGVGEQLRRTFDREDVIARWSSETFVIGVYGITQQEQEQRVSQLMEQLNQSAANSSRPPQILFCAGIAQYPDQGADLQSLYEAADHNPL